MSLYFYNNKLKLAKKSASTDPIFDFFSGAKYYD